MPFPMPIRPLPPASRPESKPQQPPPPKGLFGEKNTWREFKDFRAFAKKAPDKAIPGSSRILYQSGRRDAEKRLEGYAKKYLGKTSGLSPRELGNVGDSSSILGKLSRDIERAKSENRWEEVKKFKKDIKIYEQWQKGF